MSGERSRERLRAVVRGSVQGVGFRWYVQRTAARLELQGWVANRADRSVEVVAEGATKDIEELLQALRDGPPSSVVSAVDVQRGPALGGLTPFVIRSGSHSGD